MAVETIDKAIAQVEYAGLLDEKSLELFWGLDLETVLHSIGTAVLFEEFAKLIGIPINKRLLRGVLFHDIGKSEPSIQKLVLSGIIYPQGSGERRLINKHPRYGLEIIFESKLEGDVDVDAVYFHHEKWDGSGYPCGRAGEKIPLGARATIVVDSFDSLSKKRNHRPNLSVEETPEFMMKRAGTVFDSTLLNIFLANPGIWNSERYMQLDKIRSQLKQSP